MEVLSYEDELALEDGLAIATLAPPRRRAADRFTRRLDGGALAVRGLLDRWDAPVAEQFQQIARFEQAVSPAEDHGQVMLLLLLRTDEVSRALLLPEDRTLVAGACVALERRSSRRGAWLAAWRDGARPIMAVVEALLEALPLLEADDPLARTVRRRVDGATWGRLVRSESGWAERFKVWRDLRNDGAHGRGQITRVDYVGAVSDLTGATSVGAWLDQASGGPEPRWLDMLLRGAR